MNEKYINDLRDNQRNIERSQAKLLVDYLKQQDEFWEFQGLSEQIAFDKNQSDMILLSEQLHEWYTKAKNDEQKKILENLYIKIISISGYVMHLETVSKQSIRLFRDEQKKADRYLSEKKTLEHRLILLEKEKDNEIKKLKDEIEFINRR